MVKPVLSTHHRLRSGEGDEGLAEVRQGSQLGSDEEDLAQNFYSQS